MGLTLAPAPQGGLEVLAVALRRGGGEAAAPIPVFELPLDSLDTSAPLAHAVQLGWRYAVRQGGATAVVDVRQTEEGQLRLNRIAGSDGAADLLTAARRAEARCGEVGDFEVRLLQLPGLYLEALWLTNAAEDVFLRLCRRDEGRFDLLAEARERKRDWVAANPAEGPEAEPDGR